MISWRKILFPFSSKKRHFLENKRRHRLAKIIFIIFIVVFGFFGSFILVDRIEEKVQEIQTLATPQTIQQAGIEETNIIEKPVIDKNIVGELGATILSNPDANVEEIKSKFPEFSNVDLQVFGELGATIMNNPNITIEEVIEKFPELSGVQQTTETTGIGTPSLLKSYFAIVLDILVYVIFLYVFSILLQLIYYHGIIYVVYGHQKK